MSKDKLLEQLLILRCQLRDRGALAELIARYEKPLRYFIGGLVEDHQLAEELFQETWLSVISKIHTLKKADAFSTWLYRIARNKVYEQLRAKREFVELDEDMTAVNADDYEPSLCDDVVRLHRCLTRLKPQYKELLMLRFLEQMPYQQIAEVLSCNLGTVKSRLHHAKLALKEEMEKHS